MTDPLAHPEDVIRRIYAYVAYRIGDGPEAEDVTSTVVERALRYRGGFDPSRGDAFAWLFGIARRCIADARKAALRPEVVQDEPVGRGPEELAPERLDLRRALASLSDRDRELVALRYGGDLTAREIGHVVGMRTNAVEVALHRALMTLREELDDARIARLAHRSGARAAE
jgi:RNA polymerase sigma-70 factor (ECF subfamily)